MEGLVRRRLLNRSPGALCFDLAMRQRRMLPGSVPLPPPGCDWSLEVIRLAAGVHRRLGPVRCGRPQEQRPFLSPVPPSLASASDSCNAPFFASFLGGGSYYRFLVRNVHHGNQLDEGLGSAGLLAVK